MANTLAEIVLCSRDSVSAAGSVFSGMSHTAQVAQLTGAALADTAFIQLEDRLLAHQLHTKLPLRTDASLQAMGDALAALANFPWWY